MGYHTSVLPQAAPALPGYTHTDDTYTLRTSTARSRQPHRSTADAQPPVAMHVMQVVDALAHMVKGVAESSSVVAGRIAASRTGRSRELQKMTRPGQHVQLCESGIVVSQAGQHSSSPTGCTKRHGDVSLRSRAMTASLPHGRSHCPGPACAPKAAKACARQDGSSIQSQHNSAPRKAHQHQHQGPHEERKTRPKKRSIESSR